MRRKTKIVNETQKQPLTPEATDLKEAIRQTKPIPIEQVVYLTEINVVAHEQGSNIYKIPYPETWRTVSNMDLFIGVRSINMRNASRTYSWRMNFVTDAPGTGDHCAIDWSKTIPGASQPNFEEWVEEWNTITETKAFSY